jgi:peptide/nickel transport system substrate-binding protein
LGLARSARSLLAYALAVLAASACTSVATPRSVDQDGRSEASSGAPGPTLVIIIRVEPASIAAKPILASQGTTTTVQRRLFNAGLVLQDNREQPHPYLIEALPELNSSSWVVFPDGRMETTYHLRPDLFWHDDVALSAEDFVFAWRVYSRPDFGAARSAPLKQMEEVVAADPWTVVIRWREPYPDAAVMQAGSFPPLPRHLLQESLEASAEFPNHPYWTREYVGLGPFRLAEWEPGAFIEGVAFDRHVLGRPKIDRIRLTFIPDQNTALANLASGAAHISVDFSIRVEQTNTLKQQWAANNGGTVLVDASTFRLSQIQLRPELVNPRSLQDVRVRKALAHSVDKQALNDALFFGEGVMTDSPIRPTAPYHAELDRVVVKYPYDLRRAEQLMNEAGFVKGPDGFFTSDGEGRFTAQVRVEQSVQSERERSIMASGWRQAGFDFAETALPAGLIGTGEARATFPSLATTGAGSGEGSLTGTFRSQSIPGPENRWTGSNRGAWSNTEFDQLADAFETTLDRNERIRQVLRMARLASDAVPAIALYFDLQPIAFNSAVRGPMPFVGDVSWNVHEWEFVPTMSSR